MNVAAKLTELSLYAPELDRKRADMLHELAARVGHDSGLTREEGFENLVAINIALVACIQLGYAMSEYDRHQGPCLVRAQTFGVKGVVN